MLGEARSSAERDVVRGRDRDGERRDRNRLASQKDSVICHFSISSLVSSESKLLTSCGHI